jgi:hypothetical protein
MSLQPVRFFLARCHFSLSDSSLSDVTSACRTLPCPMSLQPVGLFLARCHFSLSDSSLPNFTSPCRTLSFSMSLFFTLSDSSLLYLTYYSPCRTLSCSIRLTTRLVGLLLALSDLLFALSDSFLFCLTYYSPCRTLSCSIRPHLARLFLALSDLSSSLYSSLPCPSFSPCKLPRLLTLPGPILRHPVGLSLSICRFFFTLSDSSLLYLT